MKLQQVCSRVRKAANDYHMIQEGDKIAVGFLAVRIVLHFSMH